MANPFSPKVELFYDSTWNDITTYAMVRDDQGMISGSRGKPNEASQVNPSAYHLLLNNRDGRFSPRNPLSPLYGKIGRNTPIRISVGTDVRFVGEVPAWPQRWDTTGTDVWVPVEAAGIMRRLGQGAKPLHSALRRSIERASDMVAYWPMEDGSGATAFASPIVGVSPMLFFGDVDPEAGNPGGSAPLPSFGPDSVFSATVPPFTAGAWQVHCVARIPEIPDSTFRYVIAVTTSSPEISRIRFGVSDTQVRVESYDSDGNITEENVTSISGHIGEWLIFRLAAFGTPTLQIFRQILTEDDEILVSSQIGWLAGVTAGRVKSVIGGPMASTPDSRLIGHMTVQSAVGAALNPAEEGATNGYVGETAGNRIERLCGEEGVAFTSTGDLDDTAAMGPQPASSFLAAVQECADADLGVLYESRASLGLAYRTRVDLYNQTAALELDYTDGVFAAIPEPVDDDQAVRNDVTVKRPDGSQARAVLETGALSIQAPPDGVGTYDTTEEVNVVGDGFLADQAAWRLALGTVDEPRFPRLPIHIHNPIVADDATLKAAVIAADLGDRINVTNMPTWVSHDTMDLLVLAVAESFNGFLWFVDLVCAPYSPYLVAEYESAEGGNYRYDTAGSSLAAQFVAGTDTSMSVDVDIGPLWTTDGDEVPFDIECGGVRLTVTAISGASSPQTFTITATPVNGVVKTIPAGTAVSLWTKARVAL